MIRNNFKLLTGTNLLGSDLLPVKSLSLTIVGRLVPTHNTLKIKKPKDKMHKLYIMRSGEFIKIGVTSGDIKKRVSSVQTGTPTPIYYVSYYDLKERDKAFSIEKSLHKKLSRRRTHGEWFVNVRDNSSEIKEVLIEYGINPISKKCIEIMTNKTIYDEISRASCNIDKYLKMNDKFKFAGLGAKINNMDTVKRVKELELKYQNALITLSERGELI